jgi:hypothetical protein
MNTQRFTVLQHEQLSAAQLPSNTYTSTPIPWGNEPGWVMVVRVAGSFSGTTPSITPELDLITNGSAARVGGALSAITSAGGLAVLYYTGSTQGPVVSSYSNTNNYQMQVKCTFANSDNVIPDVTIDLIAME